MGADQTVTRFLLSNQIVYPSCANWCALTINFNPLWWLNSSTTLWPKSHPAPLLPCAHVSIYYGSDHIKSANGPSVGIYCFLFNSLIWSRAWISGDNPPCTQNISSFLLLKKYHQLLLLKANNRKVHYNISIHLNCHTFLSLIHGNRTCSLLA